jgi:PmbA protein
MNPFLELARRTLDATPGEDAQATVTRERSLALRFARSQPTQATRLDDLSVEVIAVRDGHVGRATTRRIDANALGDCGRGAAAAAETVARKCGAGRYPGLPAPRQVPEHEGHDAQTARVDCRQGGRALRIVAEMAARRGVEAYGIWTAAEVTTAIASSEGVEVLDRVTDAFIKVICIAPHGRSGYAAEAGVAAEALDCRALAERAARKALVTDKPKRLPPGEYPVVMEPYAVAWLLELLGKTAFNGLAHAEARGALFGKLGARVAAPAVNLQDSPHCPGTLPRAFDAEGVPKAAVSLIGGGVAENVVHDTRSAALVGTTSTGHALVAGGAPNGPLPTNLVLAGGSAVDGAALCRPLARGIYVTRLWYENVVRPKETLVTAMTRDGTFLIESGEVTCPLADMRITDNALGILERVEDLGRSRQFVSSDEFYGRRFAAGVVCPPLRAAAVRFTG